MMMCLCVRDRVRGIDRWGGIHVDCVDSKHLTRRGWLIMLLWLTANNICTMFIFLVFNVFYVCLSKINISAASFLMLWSVSMWHAGMPRKMGKLNNRRIDLI